MSGVQDEPWWGGGQMVKCLECWVKEFEQWGATERQRWNEDWVGGAPQRGREIRRPDSVRTGGHKFLKTRDQLGALSSVFPFGKSLPRNTSPSGGLLALYLALLGSPSSPAPFLLGSYGKRVILLYTPPPFAFKPQSPPGSRWRR